MPSELVSEDRVHGFFLYARAVLIEPKEFAYGMISGLNLHARMRSLPAFTRIPIIILTNVDSQPILDNLPTHPRTQVHSKGSVLPTELVDLVKAELTN